MNCFITLERRHASAVILYYHPVLKAFVHVNTSDLQSLCGLMIGAYPLLAVFSSFCCTALQFPVLCGQTMPAVRVQQLVGLKAYSARMPEQNANHPLILSPSSSDNGIFINEHLLNGQIASKQLSMTSLITVGFNLHAKLIWIAKLIAHVWMYVCHSLKLYKVSLNIYHS